MIPFRKFLIPLSVVLYLWIPIVTGSSLSGLSTINYYSTVTALDSQGPSSQIGNTTFFMVQGDSKSYIWNTYNNTVAVSFSAIGGGDGSLGLFLDNDRLWFNSPGTYGGVMCFEDSSQTVLTITNSSSSFITTKVWSITNSAAHTCFVDWGRGVLWVFGKSSGYLFRVPLSRNPYSPLSSTSSAPYGLRARASAINKLTDTAYIACNDAKLIVVPLNTTSLVTSLTVLSVGVSDLVSLGIDEAQNYMFIGTDIGIGLKYTIGKWLEVQLFFIVGSIDMTGVYLQTDRNVSYWVADNGYVYRVNYDGFNFNVVYDSTNLGSSGSPVVGGFISPNDSSIAYFITDSSSDLMWRTKLFDCSVHTSCEDCSIDPYNCGWCANSAKCLLKGNCTSGSQFTNINQCPTLTSLTPGTGSTLGNTQITISGNYFPGTGTEKCRFKDGVQTTIVPYVNYTTSGSTITGIQCNTPVYNFNTATVSVDVVFTTSNISLTTNNVTQPFTYYNCSTATACGTCPSIGSECGWCMATGTCTNKANCPTSINSSVVVEFSQNSVQCPVISNVSPANGVVAGGTTVTIVGGQFIPTLQYACLFGSNISSISNATLVNLTTLQCVTPPNPTGSQGSVQNVSIVYRNQTSKVYAKGGFFIYYNCQTSNSCAVCLTGVCQWCLETATCEAVGSACDNAATQFCPVVTGINPDQTFQSTPVTVAVNGTFFPVTNYADHFVCRFQNKNNTFTASVNATYINSTTVTCISPSSFSSEMVDMTMYYKSKVYALPIQQFEYYSCNAPTCSGCVISDRPECGWCAVDNQCKIMGSGTCSEGSQPQQSCPTISSVNPDFALLDGNRNTTVTFSQNLPGYTFYCNFGGDRTDAVLIASNALSCLIPPKNETQVVNFQVDVDNNTYSVNTVPFTYLTCQDLTDDCDRCQMVDCDWCIPNYCLPMNSGTCYAKLSSCPTLNQLSPNHSELSGAAVIVTGSGFSDLFEYSVNVSNGVFSNLGQACSNINDTALDCPFPSFVQTAAIDALVTVSGVPYMLASLPYYYHNCQAQTTCGDCVAESSFCGWCLETRTCAQSCTGTFTQTCPVITLENNYATIEGGDPIKVVSNSDLFLPSINLQCTWEGVGSTPATRINNSVVTCDSPVSNATTVNFVLEYFNTSIPFYDTPISFDFIDCRYTVQIATEYPCSACSNIGEARCMWCLRDNYCGPAYMCSGEALANVNQCPFISGLDPLSGGKGGGDKLTLTGFNFVDDDNLECAFEDGNTFKTSSVTFESTTKITCKTPKWPGTGQINMRLAFNDMAFSNSLYFTYNKDSKSNDTGVIIGSVIGVIAFLALLGAGVAFLFIKRRGFGPAAVKVVEPNYSAVAFAGIMPAFKLTKADMEHLESFRQILIHKDLSLAIAMLNATKSTEADRVAKSLCYVFSSANLSVNLLTATIQDEVSIAEKSTQGRETLFRSNSMATKIFTQYAKVVGLKYLWDTLARPVAELAALGKEKDTAPDRESSIMRLDSFEVDPSRMEDVDESDLAINQLQLILICQKVFTGIMKSVESIPREIREIMRIIKRLVGQVFPESTYIGMGGFFFLRFICPAMTAPHVYGLLPHPPNEETQRYLVLLSKALQNLANNTLPGVKETYMQKMNDFITSNQNKLINFFDQMVAGEEDSNNNNNSSSVKGVALTVPKTQEDSALAVLYGHTYKESKNVYANLNDSHAKDVVSALSALFAEGPPPEQIK